MENKGITIELENYRTITNNELNRLFDIIANLQFQPTPGVKI